MLAGKKVLVTGAGGFIGSHVVEAAVEAGAQVTAMVRYGSASSWGNLALASEATQKAIKVISGDIVDSDCVFRAVEGQDIVLHLAALIAIPYSYEAPRSYLRVNVEGTLNVLEAARRFGTERVVHTSTSEVYGTALRTPIDEDHPLQGQSPYSASKIGADKMAESYFRSFKTPVVTLRPFNTFGPRQSARAFIPTIISQAFAREEVRLGSLTPERDMTLVQDTADGFLKAATTPGIEGETINLGTGETHSIGWFAERILSLMGMANKPITPEEQRMRPDASEVMKLISDNSKAKRLMNWTPKHSTDEGLTAAIAFIDQHRHLYRTDRYVV